MSNTAGAVIAAVGIVILLVGFAMPSTQTVTSCYEDPMGYGQNCVQVTAPNPSKGPAILFGVVISIVGLGVYTSGASGSSEPGETTIKRRHSENSDGPSTTDISVADDYDGEKFSHEEVPRQISGSDCVVVSDDSHEMEFVIQGDSIRPRYAGDAERTDDDWIEEAKAYLRDNIVRG